MRGSWELGRVAQPLDVLDGDVKLRLCVPCAGRPSMGADSTAALVRGLLGTRAGIITQPGRLPQIYGNPQPACQREGEEVNQGVSICWKSDSLND